MGSVTEDAVKKHKNRDQSPGYGGSDNASMKDNLSSFFKK